MARPFVCRPTAIVLITELETGLSVRNPELWQSLQSVPVTLSDGSDLGVVLASRYDIIPEQSAELMTEYRRLLYLVATAGKAGNSGGESSGFFSSLSEGSDGGGCGGD